MATTSTKIHLTSTNPGLIHTADPPTTSLEAASQILQKNHDEHHIFWREVAGHNHIAHSVLSVFALGGTPHDLQRAFDDGADIQRPLPPQEPTAHVDLAIPATFRSKIGDLDQYPNFLAYYEKQIEEKGWQEVVRANVFSKTKNAETVFAQLFEGLYHPLIHVGLGIEFAQPGIVAEGLAQASTHDSMGIEEFLVTSEEVARTAPKTGKSLLQLYEDVHDNEAIVSAAHGFTDGPARVRDGVLGRSAKEIVEIAAQFRVKPEDLERGLAETTNTSAFATGAAKRPGKEHKIDFFHMHGVTASIFLTVLLRQPWISIEDKVRLVEWKGRVDLVWYAASGAVKLRHADIEKYVPGPSAGYDWNELYSAVLKVHDDGHLVKLIRALRNGQEVSKKFESDDSFPVKGDEWFKIAQLGYDSTVDREILEKWVWGVGFEDNWAHIPSAP